MGDARGGVDCDRVSKPGIEKAPHLIFGFSYQRHTQVAVIPRQSLCKMLVQKNLHVRDADDDINVVAVRNWQAGAKRHDIS